MEHTRSAADLVRHALRMQGMSGAELARRLGVTQPYLSRRLTGGVDFRVAELEQVAAVLGMPVADLLPSQEADAAEVTA